MFGRNNSRFFNQGFETLEYTAASILDMDWHVITDIKERDVTQFDKESIARMGLIPQILPRYLSPNFIHFVKYEMVNLIILKEIIYSSVIFFYMHQHFLILLLLCLEPDRFLHKYLSG